MTELLLSFLKSISPKLADKLIDKIIEKNKVYVDRVIVSKKDNNVIFDITTSSSFKKNISLTQFYASFTKERGKIFTPSAALPISSQYKIISNENNSSAIINETAFTSDLKAWKNKGNVYLKFPLLENQTPQPNRFNIEWSHNEQLAEYPKINITLSYTVFGKEKHTNQFKIPNPFFIHENK